MDGIFSDNDDSANNGNGKSNGKHRSVDGTSLVDYEKLVKYYQRMTEATADSLELLIDKAADFVPSDEIEEFREQLDLAREHIAGWKGPMRFVTKTEATRYVSRENEIREIDRMDNRGIRLMKMIHEEGCITVLV